MNSKSSDNLEIKFYYARDQRHNPRVTVCVMRSPTECARGVAICSPKDQPCKRVGRHIAQGRAVKALKAQKSTEIVLRLDTILRDDTPFFNGGPLFKSYYAPELTPFERDLFNDSTPF